MFGTEALNARVKTLEAQVRRQQLVINALCERAGIAQTDADPFALDTEERSLIAQGKNIQAIKHHRQRTGSGLKEAKDIVDGG